MPDIIPISSGTDDDATLFNTSLSNWIDARGNASVDQNGTFRNTTSNSYDFAVYNFASSGRGGTVYRLYRSYFAFDLSGFTGTATAVDFEVRGDNLGSTDSNSSTLYMVAATSFAGATSDFTNIFTSGTTLGTLYGSGTISTTSGFHTLTGNSDMVTAVNNVVGSGTLYLGLMGYYDYNNSSPSVGGNFTKIQLQFSEMTTGKQPFLSVTGITASVTGYGNNVIGVSSGDISKVIGVATADIGKVIGVD